MNKVKCEACGGFYQPKKNGLPRGHSGPVGSYCRSPRAGFYPAILRVGGRVFVPIEDFERMRAAMMNEADAAREARKIAQGWRDTAIRHGYRDDVAADRIEPGMNEA